MDAPKKGSPEEPGRSHHDMGGLPAGRIEPAGHDHDAWERRVDAMMMLLSGSSGGNRRMSVDELRKNVESIPPATYDRMSYYERWVTSITQTMLQRGYFSTDELTRKMAEVQARAGGGERKKDDGGSGC
jgi:hypothetical protein